MSDAAYQFISICPTFTVTDWDAAGPIIDSFVAKTRTEAGCLHYGFTRSGDKLFCREAYVNADAVKAHLDNVAEPIQQMLAGPATLDGIQFHGPAAEIEALKPAVAALNPQYFTIVKGFSNCVKSA